MEQRSRSRLLFRRVYSMIASTTVLADYSYRRAHWWDGPVSLLIGCWSVLGDYNPSTLIGWTSLLVDWHSPPVTPYLGIIIKLPFGTFVAVWEWLTVEATVFIATAWCILKVGDLISHTCISSRFDNKDWQFIKQFLGIIVQTGGEFANRFEIYRRLDAGR